MTLTAAGGGACASIVMARAQRCVSAAMPSRTARNRQPRVVSVLKPKNAPRA
jgi:hypothetical protein